MYEYFFQCPYCWENISMLIDTSAGAQNYIEDCEVCCRPINMKIDFDFNQVIYIEAEITL